MNVYSADETRNQAAVHYTRSCVGPHVLHIRFLPTRAKDVDLDIFTVARVPEVLQVILPFRV